MTGPDGASRFRLAPFRALRYGEAAGDPGDLLAPPYDVVDAEEARQLRGRSPFNAVRLVLPEGDAPACYELAARRLREWTAEGLLVREERPALHVYAQTFELDGRERTRHGVFGALRLSEFGEGEVVPHEETHRGPKEDRLALTKATEAQLSPVFLLAADPADRISALLGRVVRGAPEMDARTPDGVRHRLWRIPRGPLARELRDAVEGPPLLIADGHHRYETALALGRGRPEDHPARRTLACVVAASDPGLLCLPTHRSLSRPPADAAGTADAADGEGSAVWRSFLEASLEVEALELRGGGGAIADAAADAAARAGPGALAAVAGGGEDAWLLRPAARAAADRPAPPAPVAFDRRVLRRGFGTGPDPALESGLLGYHRDPGGALRAAGRGGAAFLLPPPDVGAVRRAAEDGERLPPKSTYFWPKLPSGLLFRSVSST